MFLLVTHVNPNIDCIEEIQLESFHNQIVVAGIAVQYARASARPWKLIRQSVMKKDLPH